MVLKADISINPKFVNADRKEAIMMVHDIEDMLEMGDYDWAADTLQGIRDTIKKTMHVTEGQRKAIYNVEDAVRHNVDWK